jgi:hypothetical protein
MALYQATFKTENGALGRRIIKAMTTEDAVNTSLAQWQLKEIESIKCLMEVDKDSETVVKEIENGLTHVFLKLHHLAYAGYIVSEELTNGNEYHRTAAQWEIRALMDAVKERSEEIYSLLDALIDIQEEKILEK